MKGGKRKGAGRPLKFKERTRTISFRVPLSKADELIQEINLKILAWAVAEKKYL